MIQASTLAFLKGLARNNNREWFEKNRSQYEAAKDDFLKLVDAVILSLGKKDPEVLSLKAKDTLFRINRDVRFSKDKSPYKSHFGAYICAKGRKSTYPGYYLHLEPGKNMVGGGAYMLMPEELNKVRQEIDYNGKSFLGIIKAKKFKDSFGELKGEKLKNPPKGFDAENEMIEYLKHKNWYTMASLTDADLQDKVAVKKIVSLYEAMLPLNRFFQQALND